MRGNLVEIWKEIKIRPGQVYVYVLSFPDGRPFYVGVGTWRRIFCHENQRELSATNAKAQIMRTIIAAGEQAGYAVAGWFESWQDAAKEERRLIKNYGRADIGLGPLSNRTNGGQGTAGIKWHQSPKRVAGVLVAAEKNRGRKHTVEHKAKIGAAQKGRKRSPETLAKISAALKGRPLTPEHRAKLSAAKLGKVPPNKGKPHSDKSRAKMSATRKGWRPSVKILAAGATWRAANAGFISAKRRALWANPEYRQMMKDARHSRETTPETRRRISEGAKRGWVIRRAATKSK